MAVRKDKRGRTVQFTEWLGGSLIVTDQSKSTGTRYFVDSTTGTDQAGNGYSPSAPLATLDYCISNRCLDDAEDIVYLMPGHAETVAAAADIVLDIRGVQIIGIGRGSNRPTFTFEGVVGADIDFDAAEVTMRNIKFLNTEDGLTAALDINAADCGVFDCFFLDEGANNTVNWIEVAAAGDRFQCIDCWNEGTDTAGNDAFITFSGAASYCRVERLRSHGDFAAANIEMTAAATDVLIKDCRLENLNAVDVCIECFAAATGWIVRNYMVIVTDAQVTWINTPGNCYLFENYGVNDAGEEGLLVGTPSV